MTQPLPVGRVPPRVVAPERHDERLRERLVPLTLAAARAHSAGWLDDAAAARREIDDAFAHARCLRVALAGARAAGWVAASPCDARAWEIHPLLVDPDRHGGGIGRALVRSVERHAAAHGARTMTLSTSDSLGATSLHGVDLFPDPLAALARLELRPGHAGHALGFWRRMGYAVSGVLPDAEGPGLHSIFLAKPLAPPR